MKLKLNVYENLIMEDITKLYLMDQKTIEVNVYRKKSRIIVEEKNIVLWFLVSTSWILICL